MPVLLATRYLSYSPWRTLFMCLSIAAVISVILILDGFQEGLYHQLRSVVMNGLQMFLLNIVTIITFSVPVAVWKDSIKIRINI